MIAAIPPRLFHRKLWSRTHRRKLWLITRKGEHFAGVDANARRVRGTTADGEIAATVHSSKKGDCDDGAFGERMQREREMRRIGLDEIAESTKIASRMLRALECEEFDNFRRHLQ